MEERLPASDTDTATTNNILLPPSPGAASLETYVVQIPRDQIYRVPPPEHARIVEDHIRTATKPEPRRRSCIFCYVIPVVVVLLIIATTLITVRETVYTPVKPKISISGINGKNLNRNSKGKPEFEITISAIDSNSKFSVSYKEGGEVSLIFKEKTIGDGKIPSIEAAKSGAANFTVVLAGRSEITASKEIQGSLTDEKDKSMQLTMKVEVEMNSWLRNEGMNLEVSCDFRVHNSLMNATNVLFQHCQTKS